MKPKNFPLVTLLLLLFASLSVWAQLGDTDVSSFTVQNLSGSTATIDVTFYAENGTSYHPSFLDAANTVANPISLANGLSKQINVSQISTSSLPAGRYAVVLSSDVQIFAQAGLGGDTATLRFSGAYIGFSSGATTVYLPSVAYNYYGWYSMVTVQNIGSSATKVTATFTCASGTTGTLELASLPANSSVTWPFKTTTPTGFTAGSTQCDGSAKIESTGIGSNAAQPIVVINNQNQPGTGATNSFEGSSTGATKLYVTSLSNNFYGWSSALTIRKLLAGNTTVTVDYSGAWPNSTCNLTDAVPSCKLVMPAIQPTTGRYSAVLTTNNSYPLLAIIGTTNGGLSGAVRAIDSSTATNTVAAPNVAKSYYGWGSAITCQNVSTTPTTLHVEYAGYAANAYNTATTLNEGESTQIVLSTESFLPASGWQGGVTVTANAAGALIGCVVGNTNSGSAKAGDWTVSYNAFNK